MTIWVHCVIFFTEKIYQFKLTYAKKNSLFFRLKSCIYQKFVVPLRRKGL